MNELQTKLELVLGELRDQIIDFVETDRLKDADFFLEQYIKLSPDSIERYSLEALIRSGQADLDRAEKVLKEGLGKFPLSFDLLYNLGFVYVQMENFLEAYHLYMKARYRAETAEEKADIASAILGLVDHFRGGSKVESDKIFNVVMIGDKQLTLTSGFSHMLKRKELLGLIERHIDQNCSTVLELGFADGMISKTLNYFGYDVTAVDPVKERMLHVIAKEWHDNILQPDQKVAQYWTEEISADWLQQIPEFDVIIVVGEGALVTCTGANKEDQNLLELILRKACKQLFIRVATESVEGEFSKDDLEKVAALHDLYVNVLSSEDGFELCLIEKEAVIERFKVPTPLNAQHSSSTLLDVDLRKCTDMYGAGYIDDWHHFVETLKEYKGNPEITYDDSVLKQYYAHFQPRNLEDGLFTKRGRASKLRSGWIGYPWYWSAELKVIFENTPAETRPGGNHHFGPNTDEFGQGELARLTPLYTAFKQQGYQPELFSDGYISGYLLVNGEDYRFVVTEGQHRVACLATLGYESIRVRFSQKPEYPRIVRFEDAKKWPQVVNGAYSRTLALKVFERFFMEGVGRERMGLA